MATKSKVYDWYYSNSSSSGGISNNRPQIDYGPHTVPYSEFTVADSSMISGSISSVTVSLLMRREGSSTVNVKAKFTLSNGTSTYSSDGWVTCSDITVTNTKRHTLTMSAANCPPASFFNNKNFTLTVKYSDASRSGIYCVKGNYFRLTVNYNAPSIYVYNGGWKEATPYVYSGGWKQANPSVYSGGWK